ncbi:MAG: Arc family DNA-binding protein [Mucinivorans sp.]
MEKEAKTKNFALRLEQQQMEAIEKWAADEFRSVNGQIAYLLSEALRKSGRTPKKKKGTQDE